MTTTNEEVFTKQDVERAVHAAALRLGVFYADSLVRETTKILERQALQQRWQKCPWFDFGGCFLVWESRHASYWEDASGDVFLQHAQCCIKWPGVPSGPPPAGYSWGPGYSTVMESQNGGEWYGVKHA